MTARVVESESVDSHVFSWSGSRFFKVAGVGVGFSKMLESGVGVGFLKLLESESVVFQNCWSRSQES